MIEKIQDIVEISGKPHAPPTENVYGWIKCPVNFDRDFLTTHN